MQHEKVNRYSLRKFGQHLVSAVVAVGVAGFFSCGMSLSQASLVHADTVGKDNKLKTESENNRTTGHENETNPLTKDDENNKNILTENKADKNSSEETTWNKDDFFTTNNGKTLGGRVDIQTPEGTKNVEMSGFSAKGKEKLKKNHHVVIPEGIEIIDSVAFIRPNQTPDDEYIDSVTFPSTLKKIGYGAFHSQKIKGTLEIPEGVTEISPGAFISNQIEKVILPSTLVNGDFDGISNRAFQDNKIREVVLKENFKNVKFQIDGNDRKYMSAGPFDNQNLGEITASVGSEFKMPFVINQIGESDIQSLGGFKINNVPTQIENCDFLTKKDGKYIITKAGKYPAQFLFYDSHGRTNHPVYGFTRPFASINFTYNIVQNNTVTFMDDDKVIKKVEVENGKNIDSDNITEEKGQMPKNPAKQGYIFKGWNTKKDGTGQDFTKTTKVTEDIIVYAIYDENTYKVNYNFKSADDKNLPVEVTNLIPKDENKYKKGKKITPADPAQKERSVEGGKWTFLGYDPKEQTVEDKDVTFTGTWKFTSIKPLSTLNEAPNLQVKDAEITVGETLNLKDLIIKAADKEDGDLKDKVEINKGEFNNNKVGTYKITYKVTDSKGATATKQATVTVKEKTKPNTQPEPQPEPQPQPQPEPQPQLTPQPQPQPTPQLQSKNTLPRTGTIGSSLVLIGSVLVVMGVLFQVIKRKD